MSGYGYNTGAKNTLTAVAHTVQPTLTIPAGVLPGDVMIVAVSMFTFTPTNPGITLTPAVGSWTQVGGGLQSSPAAGGLKEFGAVWKRVATAADAGTTLTFAFTGTPGSTDQFWWAIDIVAYTGFSDVDVSNLAGTGTSGNLLPSGTSGALGELVVAIGSIAVAGSGSVSSLSGAVIRQNANTAGIACVIADTVYGVGASGTAIGGGSFVTTGGAGDQWCDFILTLKPIAQTLWGQGLTTAVASDSSAYTLGIEFSATQANATLTLTGIWFYSGPTANSLPTQIALFTAGPNGQVGSLIHSEAATWSGAAGSGWVRAAFAIPQTLTSGALYKAAILIAGSTSLQYAPINHYWDTGAGASGITSGVLNAPNSSNSNFGQDSFHIGNAVTYPDTSFQGSNYLIDPEVLVVSSAPAGGALLLAAMP